LSLLGLPCLDKFCYLFNTKDSRSKCHCKDKILQILKLQKSDPLKILRG